MDRFAWSSGLLEIGESLVLQQRGVRLYDGDEKVRAGAPASLLPARPRGPCPSPPRPGSCWGRPPRPALARSAARGTCRKPPPDVAV